MITRVILHYTLPETTWRIYYTPGSHQNVGKQPRFALERLFLRFKFGSHVKNLIVNNFSKE